MLKNKFEMYNALKDFVRPYGEEITEETVMELAQERGLSISYDDAIVLVNQINSEIESLNMDSDKSKPRSEKDKMYIILKPYIDPDSDYFSEDKILEMAEEKGIDIGFEDAIELANKVNADIDFVRDEELKNKRTK